MKFCSVFGEVACMCNKRHVLCRENLKTLIDATLQQGVVFHRLHSPNDVTYSFALVTKVILIYSHTLLE